MTLAYLVLRFSLVRAQVFVNVFPYQILITRITTHGISLNHQSWGGIVIQMNLLLAATNGTVNTQKTLIYVWYYLILVLGLRIFFFFRELWLSTEGDSNHIGSSLSVFLVLLDTPSNSRDDRVKVQFTLKLKDWIDKNHLQKTGSLCFYKPLYKYPGIRLEDL